MWHEGFTPVIAMATTAAIHLFGIRHHGPGSARSLLAVLEALAPDILLVEGPPEGDPMLPLARHAAMQPPVALLVYAPGEPRRAAFYPFAVFTPEWQAIRYGLMHDLPVRFMDLPQRHWLALAPAEEATGDADPGAAQPDPLLTLARAAGHDDVETWWEQFVEARGASIELFAAILEAMTALRAAAATASSLESLREAAMRTALRAAQREGYARIAVVCGAWHVPALALDRAGQPSAKADAALLRGLPKIEVAVTWAPWSYGHLARASGYGAGITSPGWYAHLWATPHDRTVGWLSRVAGLLREADLNASPAQVIDAVRLAEAALAALCYGNPLPLQLISEKLIVGDRLGAVPEEAPAVPLDADLQAQQRRLRLPPDPTAKPYDLDLRQPIDLGRSQLLHRLLLLGVPWGKLGRVAGARGTFHELWTLQWEPAFAIAVIEMARWGNTVAETAAAYARHLAASATDLAALTALLDQVLLADLAAAVEDVMAAVQARAALTADVTGLMAALPPLARTVRYGDVRGAAAVDAAALNAIIVGLVERICIGLPLACATLDDDAAGAMLERIEAVQEALAALQSDDLSAAWRGTLAVLADQVSLHGLIAGRCCRLLLDDGSMTREETGRRLHLALSPGNAPTHAAAWLEGWLRGSGLLLLHDGALWGILDAWLAGLSAEAFINALPLLRRAFSVFPPAERRQLGELAACGARGRPVAGGSRAAVDAVRGDAILPLLAAILGLTPPATAEGDAA
jgi:hypothetical protein